ncbi:hypothetical protein ACLOJK_025783 [Asimina triloba]
MMWFCEWRKCDTNRHLWVSLLSRKLPEVGSVALKELCVGGARDGVEDDPRVFQSHDLKWYLSKGAFFWWCQGLPFFSTPAVSAWEEAEDGCLTLDWGVTGACSLLIRLPSMRGPPEEEEMLGESTSFLPPASSSYPLLFLRGFPDAYSKSDLQVRLVLSREEARHSDLVVVSPEAVVKLVHSRLLSLFVPMMDLDAGTLSPAPFSKEEPSETPTREARVIMPRGVLGVTLGEMSSGSVDVQLFRCPFDIEARALKILGDLLPVQSRSLRKSHALGLTAPPDKEGRGLAKLLLLEFLLNLEERILLIDRCSSRAEYRYHVPRFGMSRIISGKECRKIIAVGKRLEELGVAQVTKEVMRPDASFPSAGEYLEESLMAIVSEVHHMAGEEPRVELE